MIYSFQKKITIIKIRKPSEKTINNELQWFGDSLGLSNLRDKDKSCFRIFIELLKSTKRKENLNSDELASKLGLTRGTIIHHINKLIDAGLVVHERKKYLLRVANLRDVVSEIKKDLDRVCLDLDEIAKDIDRKLEL